MFDDRIEDVKTTLEKGKITRREFIARVSVLGLAATLSPALLTSPANASTPKKGGRFRIGLTGASTSDTLDPAALDDQMDIHASFCIRNQPVELDHANNPIPELAENCSSDEEDARYSIGSHSEQFPLHNAYAHRWIRN